MTEHISAPEAPVIPLTSTGPFAPPPDFSDDEILQIISLGLDVQAAHAGFIGLAARRARPASSPGIETLNVLEGQIDAALERLSKSGPFLSHLANKIGEAGFEFALARADLKDTHIVSAILDKAGQAGGFVPMLEQRLSNAQDTFSSERVRMKATFDSLRNNTLRGRPGTEPPTVLSDEEPIGFDFASPGLCTLGAFEMTVGVLGLIVAVGGTVATAGLTAPKGAVVAVGSSGLLGSGTALVATQC